MSGELRRKIGLRRHFLARHVDKCPSDIVAELPDDPTEREVKKVMSKLLCQQKGLEANSAALEQFDAEWGNLIELMEGEERQEEQRRWDEVAEGISGYRHLVLEATERIHEVQVELEQLGYQCNRSRSSSLVSKTSVISKLNLVGKEPRMQEESRIKMWTEEQLGSTCYQQQLEEEIRQLRDRVQCLATTVNESQQGRQPSLVEFGQAQSLVKNQFSSQLGQPRIRLREIKLPSFKGESTQWPGFWQMFNQLINNTPMEPCLKMSYLISCLGGTAYTAVSGLAITNENYEVAINTLKSRFGCQDTVVASLYAKIERMRKPRFMSVKELRRLVDEVEQILQQLEAVGESVENKILVRAIMRILPLDVVTKIHEQKGEGSCTMGELRQNLRKELQLREKVQYLTMGSEQSDYSSKSTNKSDSYKGHTCSEDTSTDTFVVTTESKDFKKGSNWLSKRSCVFCRGEHYHDECDKYETVNQRKKRLAEIGRSHCFICLNAGHRAVECPRKKGKKCFYCSAVDRHHQALCYQRKKTESSCSNEKSNEANEQNAVTITANIVRDKKLVGVHTAMLCTAKAAILHPDDGTQRVIANLFLDEGSEKSFITKRLAKKLKLPIISTDHFKVKAFATAAKQVKSDRVFLKIALRDGSTFQIVANVMPMLTSVIRRRPLSREDIEALQRVNASDFATKLPIDVTVESVPDILLGADYVKDLTQDGKYKLPSGLWVTPSKLGLLLSGKQLITDGERVENKIFTSSLIAVDSDENRRPHEMMKNLWSLESIGVLDCPAEVDTEKAQRMFDLTVKREDGRYTVRLPWKSDTPQLGSNFGLAVGRLRSQVRALERKGDNLLKQYDKVIRDQLEEGIIKEVLPTDIAGQVVHYLPHQAVLTPQKLTTKLRVVYDASAKEGKNHNSLNDCLYPGPVLLPNLVGILIRFRLAAIVLTADVKKAFLQVGLQKIDQDATRFVWLKDISKPPTKENLKTYVFTRIVFGLNCSPFLLAATLKHHLKNRVEKKLAKEIENNTYVDNILLTARSVEEAIEKYDRTNRIFQDAKMQLQEWDSSNPEVCARMKQNTTIKSRSITETKLLGIRWNQEDDTLLATFTMKRPREKPTLTKRVMLATQASLFDPMGLFTPVTLRGKRLLQEIFTKDYSWDEIIPQNQAFRDVVTEYEKLEQEGKVKRRLPVVGAETVQLHVFSDASETAYGAAVYIRWLTGNQWQSQLLFSKTRLLPRKKTITMPKAELMGALIGKRVAKLVKRELEEQLIVKEVTLWTDSKIVLGWLTTKKQLTVYVENRVKEISSDETINKYRYVQSSQNPADVASRGSKTMELMSNTLWWNGPPFLEKSKEEWPEWTAVVPDMSRKTPENFDEYEAMEEGFKTKSKCDLVEIKVANVGTMKPMIEIERFSTLPKLFRTTVYVLRFLKNKVWERLSSKTKQRCESMQIMLRPIARQGPIMPQEFDVVRCWWDRREQKTQFADAIEALENKKRHPLIDHLGLYLDTDCSLRCRGRMHDADLPSAAKTPILLPARGHYTMLVIQEAHQKTLHSGMQHTLCQVRRRYWLLKGRQAVRNVIGKCRICRKFSAKPFALPPMPALPEIRVKPAAPFKHTGLDYIGPISYKSETSKRKAWICLFTCLSTRAIHLEPVWDLTAVQFIGCFRRFVARRNKPDSVILDNAPQFKLGSEVLNVAWERVRQDEETVQYCSKEKIEWYFIPAYSPWQGSVYERLVQSVKSAFRRAIGRQVLQREDLQTTLAEIEAVVNTRPLTYQYSDLKSQLVVRPVDLMGTGGNQGTPHLEEKQTDPDYEPVEDQRAAVLKRLRQQQSNLDHFWRIWREEYLTSLREKHKMNHKEGRLQTKREPQRGEIVIVKEDNVPRGSWKLGRIINVRLSADGAVRSAKVLSVTGKEMQRPVSLLYPLEIEGSETDEESNRNEQSGERVTKNQKEKTATQRNWWEGRLRKHAKENYAD